MLFHFQNLPTCKIKNCSFYKQIIKAIKQEKMCYLTAVKKKLVEACNEERQ